MIVVSCTTGSIPWLGGTSGLAETLVYNLFLADSGFSKEPLSFWRQEFLLDDGGLVSLDWCKNISPTYLQEEDASNGSSAPILITFPGWGTTNRTGYIKDWVRLCVAQGYRVAVLNYRGSAGMPLTSHQLPNFTDISDTRHVVDSVHKEHPNALLCACGFSIGANMLSNYLGKVGANTPLVAACSISNPYDLDGMHILETKFPLNITVVRQVYEKLVLDGIKKRFKRYRNAMEQNKLWDFEKAMSMNTIDDLAAYISLNMFGFKSQKEYLDAGSSKLVIKHARVPLLCISAANDPLVPPENLEFLNEDELYAQNTDLVCVISSHGGHFSFLQGVWGREPWNTKTAVEFLNFFVEERQISK